MENIGRMISLNGGNYHLWKGKMEDLLFVKSLHIPVFQEKKPDDKTDDEWKLMHRQVCGSIRQWVDDNVLHHIENETDARSLWLKLEQLYARKTGNNKMYMIKKLIELRYQEGTPMTDHLNAFQGLLNKLSDMGIKFDDEIHGLWLLGTLPDSWEVFTMSLCNSASNGSISMDLVKNSVLNEETRRQSSSSSSRSDVMVTESRGRSSHREPKKDKNRSRSKSNKFANLECHYCHKKGHMKKDCWKMKRDNKQGNKQGDGEDRVTVTDDQFLILLESDAINVACQDTSWVVDSGATTHATSQRDLFTTYTSGSYGSVKMGNDGLAQVVGIGDICLETSLGTRLMLKGVKHVPDIRLNLISTGRLDDEGFYSLFGGGKWKLSRGSMVMARGENFPFLSFTLTVNFNGSALVTRALIENTHLIKWSLVLKALSGLFALICGNGYIVGINQIYDIGIDKVNKPYLPIAAGDLSVQSAWLLVIFFAIAGVLVVGFNFGPFITSLYTFGLFLGTIYSVPPFRMKRFPVAAFLIIATVRGFLLNFGVYHATRAALGLPFQWSAPVAFITSFVTLFALVIAITKDLPDVEGDRKFQISTLATKLGVRNIAFLGSGLLLVNYISAISLAFYMPQVFRGSLMIPAHMILASCLVFQTWVLEKANYTKEAISEYYRFIWNLFYAEYLLFPFL